MQKLAAELGRETQAEELLDAELSSVVPALEWVIPFVFQNRRFGYLGDPHMLPGVVSFAETLGAEVAFAVVPNRPIHARELPPELRLIMTLFMVEGLTYEQIALRMEVPVGTVTSRLYRARRSLRERLREHLPPGFGDGRRRPLRRAGT